MRDVMDCRDWVENHQAFTDGLDRGLNRGFGKIMAAFLYLARYNFSAPWTEKAVAKAKQTSC